ncbi:MAG TPA: MMPL family transporter [Candidatus Dormibacteraeota bacterium]|nr:MMPL family transporter [Candidatus Dormibacteraeota bacterium]
MGSRPRLTAGLVVAAALVVVALAAPFAAKLSGIQQNDPAAFLPSSAQSTQVTRLLGGFQGASSIPVIVVYERKSGITPADTELVAGQAAAVSAAGGVVGGVSPVIASSDGQALQFFAELNAADFLKVGEEVDAVRARVHGQNGLVAHVTGPAALAADFGAAFKGLDVKLLLGTGLVVIVILLLVYRSPVLWMLPISVVGISLLVAQALVYMAAARFGLQSNGQSQGILTILVFGAGTDYALLLISRYREELRHHASAAEAVLAAWRGAAPAILASGCTVILALVVLLLSEQGANRTLGGSSAIGIAVVMIAMLTLMPAILALAGRWLFWPVVPHVESTESTGRLSVWDRVAAAVGRRPRATWLAAAGLLLFLILGLTNLNASGLPADRQYTTTLDSVAGQHVADRHFAAGAGSPLYVVTSQSTQADVTARLESLDGITSVSAYSDSAVPGAPAKVVDSRVLLLAGTELKPDGRAAQDLVVSARSTVAAVPNSDALVGGTAARSLDQRLASERDNRVIIPLVLVLILVVLLILLRAILASVLLIATVVLSYLATLGASAFVFEHVFHLAGEDPSWPLTTFVFLVALGIDYNIFLMTRVREETRKLGTRPGVVSGLARTGGVITSAGVVLAATFAVFTALPLVVLVEVGFAIALGVLVDTAIVRSLLVPGLMYDIGDPIWWPGRPFNARAAQAGKRLRDETAA